MIGGTDHETDIMIEGANLEIDIAGGGADPEIKIYTAVQGVDPETDIMIDGVDHKRETRDIDIMIDIEKLKDQDQEVKIQRMK